MLRRLILLLAGLLGLVAVAVVMLWVLLAAPFFSSFRRSIVETALTEQIGQPLIVNDDVRVQLGMITRVYVSGVEIPSERIANTTLAELNLLEMDVTLASLFQGGADIDNLNVDGLQINLITLPDGTTSWTPLPPSHSKKDPATAPSESQSSKGPGDENGHNIFSFLSDKTASFTAIGLKMDNQVTGFSFLFDLKSLRLDQLDGGQLVSVTSQGLVNGAPFAIDGKYPRGKPFTTNATFGELRLDFNGHPLTPEQGNGFTGTLTLDTGEFGEVLDILGLQRVLEGNGRLSADLLSQGHVLRVDNLVTDIALAGGQLITVNGEVGNLLNGTGFDIKVNARLYPEGQPPAKAESLKDLKLSGFYAHIVSHGDAVEFEDLEMATNAFEQGLSQIGPISIGQIKRSETGELSLLDVSLQMGPRDAPFVVAHGELRDVLQLKGLELEGHLQAPASLLLHSLDKGKSDAFGGLKADFAITDASGHISLTHLHAYANDTQLWSLEVETAVPNVTKLDGFTFSLDLDVPDGAAFLKALDLEPVDVGPLEITASAKGAERALATTASLAAGQSLLKAALDLKITDGAQTIRGLISSENLRIDDLTNGVSWLKRVAFLAKPDAAGHGSKVGDGGKIEEPLVLGTKADPPDDGKPEEPLVLGTKTTADTSDGKPSDLVDPVEMLAKLDLEIGIEIKEITGQQGVSSVSSDLAIKEGKARFGPLEFSYGGGYFNLSAAMDMIETPKLLNVSGSTGGWDLGALLKTAGLDIDARGKLRGQFDITGNRTSAKRFINSMYGSATVSMTNGAIASSLLELAGLGVFPWLFSTERNQGYTNIVCVVAPVKIQGGKVSSNAIVAETESVQMVITGAVDWRNDTISMRAEPRPVGRPLSRSAWPFNISGRLSDPEFKLQIGGSRSKRVDGADVMPANRKPCTSDMLQLK